MKALFVACLSIALAGCSLLRGNSVNLSDVADVAASGAELQRQYEDCVTFSEKPISYAEESAIGGAIALGLAAKSKGGVFVEVSPELVNLTSIPKDTYDKDKKPTPGVGPKTDLTTYLNTLGQDLGKFSERPTIAWTFMVLDNPTANAFSAPGGYVFVTTGMLRQVQNEAQLAGILGHEIGHVTGRHALEAYKKSKLVTCLSAYMGDKATDAAVSRLLGPLSGSVGHINFADEVKRLVKGTAFDPNELTGPFVQFITNKIVDWLMAEGYGAHEKDADAVATRIVTFAGYDVAEYEKVVAGLPEGVQGGVKHPPNQERLVAIAEARKDVADFAGVGKAPPLSPTVAAAK